MSNHSDKIYNGLCVECLSNYGRILNEKQTEINKLVNEMRNLTFPHLDITMISKSQVQTTQVENTRDELMTNIFPTQNMLEKKDEVLKSIKESLKEEISNIPKKKMGRPKKIQSEKDGDKPKWNYGKLLEASKTLEKQDKLVNKDSKKIFEAEKILEEQKNLIVQAEYHKRTRGRGKSVKTLEKEKALQEAQNNTK